MKIELINKQDALSRVLNIKDKAFSIAKSYGTLPGYCEDPTCVLYCNLISLFSLKDNEVCVFVDGFAAKLLTNFELNNGYFIGKMLVKNLLKAYFKDGLLNLVYNDGLVEIYEFDLNGYFKFKENNFAKNFVGEVYYGALN